MNEFPALEYPVCSLQRKGQSFLMGDQELEFYFRSIQCAWSHMKLIQLIQKMEIALPNSNILSIKI